MQLDHLSLDTPLPWQKQVLDAKRRFNVIVAHRKARKTLLNIWQLNRWAEGVPGTYWFIFPTLSQAKKVVWDDPDMLERNVHPLAWKNRNITDRYLQYPNGSKLYILGSKEKDSLRGPNPRGVIFDEYDDQDQTVWPAIIQPIMSANPDAWCWFTGTYKGKKDLFAKTLMPERNPEWFSIVVKASESGIISGESLAEAKRTMPQAIYEMEMECIPVEGGMSFFPRIRESIWEGVFTSTVGRMYKIGADLAKLNDFTVLTPVETSERPVAWGENDRFYVGMPERFNQIDWPLQQARIEAIWGRYNRADMTLDATGVGNVLIDYLRQNIKNLDAITFTEAMRMDLLKNLSLMLAEDKLWLPDYPQLIEELESVSYDITKSGRVTIGVASGMHDDCVMSLALAVWKIKKQKPVQRYETVTNFRDQTDELWKG